jgi:hypothetical protein
MSLWQKIKSALSALCVDCRGASLAQSEMLDHPLPTARHIGLRLHVILCAWCRRYGRQLRFLHRAAQQHPEELSQVSPHTLPPAAKERIKRSLREQK